MSKESEIIGSITAAIKDAVADNDEGLLDAAIQDYQARLARLAATGQYESLNRLFSAVQKQHSVTDLINLKGAISSAVLTKALTLTPLWAAGLPSKASSKSHGHNIYDKKGDLPPNAPQSIAIAQALVISRKDDLAEMVSALKYFSRLGHQQAISVILAHCLDSGLMTDDEQCGVLGSLTHLVGKTPLHASLLKVLNERKELVQAEFDRLAKVWVARTGHRHFEGIFKLDMLEKMNRQGLRDQALLFAKAYDQIYLIGAEQEPCVIQRLYNIGVESVSILSESKRGRSDYGPSVSPIPWVEYLMTSEAVSVVDIPAMMKGFNFDYSRKNAPLKAIRQVLDYQAQAGDDSGIDRASMLEKAAEVLRITIDGLGMARDVPGLNKILDDYQLPHGLALKVKALKGIILERDLGM